MHFGVNPYQDLREKGAGRVDQDIAESRLAKRHKGLVPFIEPRVTDGNQQRKDGPLPFPPVTLCPHTMKHGHAENAEFGDVRQFPDTDVHQAEDLMAAKGEEPPQSRKNDTAGLLAAEIMGRKHRDQDSHCHGGKPVF